MQSRDEVSPSECKLKMLQDCNSGMLLWSEAFVLKLRCSEVEATSVTGLRQEDMGDIKQAGRAERLTWGSRAAQQLVPDPLCTFRDVHRSTCCEQYLSSGEILSLSS